METIKIYTHTYGLFGKVRGHQKDKFNRATKLAYRFEELDAKLRGIVQRGIVSNTEHSRCSLALLLMMNTGIRLGNEGSAEGYYTKPHPHQKDQTVRFVQTYGLTTLKPEHIEIVNYKKCLIDFVGKKQVANSFVVTDKELVRWLAILKDYSLGDAGELPVFGITPYMLTKFVKKHVGRAFSPKDFRCMKANLYAWEFANEMKWPCHTKKETKQQIKTMYDKVAQMLNNTPGVCKKSYVCPKLELFFNQNNK